MSLLLQISVTLCSLKTLSYGIWCLKYDKNNLTGSISVLFLGAMLLCVLLTLIFN